MLQRKLRWLATLAVALLLFALPALSQIGIYGRSNEITALLFLPNGKTVVAAGLDEKIHIHDVTSGKQKSEFQAHKDGVWAAALSPDGKLMATGGGDKQIRLWDTATFKEIRTFEGHTKEVLAVTFSPDGKTLASGGGDRSIRTWDIATGKQKKVWHGHELKVLSVAYSPDGKILASGGTCTVAIPGLLQGGTHADHVRFWDVETGKEIRQHAQRGTSVCYTPNGRAFAAAGVCVLPQRPDDPISSVSTWRGTVFVLSQPMKDKPLAELTVVGSAMALSADGGLAALAVGSRVHLNATTARISGDYLLAEPSHTTLWAVASSKKIMLVAEESASAVAFSPDGTKLASGLINGELKIRDLSPKDWPYLEKKPKLSATELENLWIDLADEEAATAYEAVWTLTAAGKSAVNLFKDKLHPQKAADIKKVKELVQRLESDKFAQREQAFEELKKLGAAAESELRLAANDKKMSAEARNRLQKLLEPLEKRPGSREEIRQARALQVLERIASPDAQAILSGLADGAPGAWFTEEAALALKRTRK